MQLMNWYLIKSQALFSNLCWRKQSRQRFCIFVFIQKQVDFFLILNSNISSKPRFLTEKSERIMLASRSSILAPEYLCIFLANLLIISHLTAYSQNKTFLIPYRQGELWGYCNSQKKIVIPARYEETTPFWGELAKVKMAGKWGLIDQQGKIFVPCEYDLIFGSQKKELIIACKGGDPAGHGGRWGFVFGYQGGNIALEYELIRETNLDGLLAVKKNNYWGCINERGTFIIPIEYEIPSQTERWHTENVNNLNFGDFKNPAEASPYPKLRFVNDYTKLRKNQFWGYLNRYGNPILPFEYDWIGELGDGLINVNRAGKFGYQSLDNQTVIPFQYPIAFPFSEGLAIVNLSESQFKPQWQVIDKKGKLVFKIPAEYQLIDYQFKNGLLRIRAPQGEMWLNQQGKKIGNFDQIMPFVYYWAIALKNQKCGLINKKGKAQIPFLYDVSEKGEPYAQIMRDLVKLRYQGKWGVLGVKNQALIDFAYDEIIFPTEWDYYESPNEALFAVKKGKQWGFINLHGRVVIPFKYEKVGVFEGFLAKVRCQGKLGYIDKTGNEFWEE
jgi:hypothetical protein